MHRESEYIINKLNLVKLIEEGGYYRETYRSSQHILINIHNDKNPQHIVYSPKLDNESSDFVLSLL